MQKIFCIGETNTGSDAIYIALQILNLKCLYANKRFNKAYLKDKRDIINDYFDNYDAFLEGPFRRDYRTLNIRIHNRFIFTDRDPIPWITDVVNLKYKKLDRQRILELISDYVSFRKELLLYFKDKYNFVQIDVFDGGKSFLKWRKLLDITDHYDYFDIYDTKFPKPTIVSNLKFPTFEHIQEHFNISNNEFAAAVKGYRQEY